MPQSNFNLVKDFHKKFQHLTLSSPDIKVFENKELLKNRLKLITEEFNELKDAINNNDFVEMADALTDMLYVIYGFGHVVGVDLDKCFKLVHESNMTKLCNTEQEAIDTVEWYETKGPEYSPEYRLMENDKFLVYDSITNKTLKSRYYSAVDLSFLTK